MSDACLSAVPIGTRTYIIYKKERERESASFCGLADKHRVTVHSKEFFPLSVFLPARTGIPLPEGVGQPGWRLGNGHVVLLSGRVRRERSGSGSDGPRGPGTRPAGRCPSGYGPTSGKPTSVKGN